MINLLFTVGNGMMGDDAAGVLLAGRLREAPLEGWLALHGGAMPENALYRVRELAPERVLIIDAAEMDLPPGAIRRIRPECIDDPFLLTTHALPLTFLIEALQEFVPRVDLIGIQPELVAFGVPVSACVKQAVDEIYTRLKSGREDWETL
jgi:hydrogenase 3 maturation protease